MQKNSPVVGKYTARCGENGTSILSNCGITSTIWSMALFMGYPDCCGESGFLIQNEGERLSAKGSNERKTAIVPVK